MCGHEYGGSRARAGGASWGFGTTAGLGGDRIRYVLCVRWCIRPPHSSLRSPRSHVLLTRAFFLRANPRAHRTQLDWVQDTGAATTTWGVIENWDTSLVTDMSGAFDAARNKWEASDLGDFHNDKSQGISVDYKSHTTAIGFSACGSGGSVFTKMKFTGTATITFDFAGIDGGYMGFSKDTTSPSSTWPIATDTEAGGRGLLLDATGEWKSYTYTHMCEWTSCHIMLEDFKGTRPTESCGNVYFDNFVVENDNTKANAFTGDLASWKTASVTTMRFMFRNAHAFNSNLAAWDTSSVVGVGLEGMFEYARAFNSNLQTWNTIALTSVAFLFRGATAFEGNGVDAWNIDTVQSWYLGFGQNAVDEAGITSCNKMKIYDSWTKAHPALTTDEVIVDDRAAGGYGGYCTCPGGGVYGAGDKQGSSCASLMCEGGTSGECFSTRDPAYSFQVVKCGRANPTQASCLSQAVSLFGSKVTDTRAALQIVANSDMAGIPLGCSVNSGGDWAAYYNNATSGPTADVSFTTLPYSPVVGWGTQLCPAVSHLPHLNPCTYHILVREHTCTRHGHSDTPFSLPPIMHPMLAVHSLLQWSVRYNACVLLWRGCHSCVL